MKPVRGINVPGCAKMPKSFFEKMLAFATEIGMKGLGYLTLLEDGSFKGPIAKIPHRWEEAGANWPSFHESGRYAVFHQ